jgi:DNA (cytosine-5)-methyltransferase 1
VYGQGSFAQFVQGQISTIRQAGGDLGGGSENLVVQEDVTTQPIFSFDTQFGSNAAVFENQSPTLKATQQSPSVTMPGLAVRRLTPLECERLQGWPDDHTRWTADGKEQADTHRYRQCGNGVATPVAAWVAKHIKEIL